MPSRDRLARHARFTVLTHFATCMPTPAAHLGPVLVLPLGRPGIAGDDLAFGRRNAAYILEG